MKYKYKAIVKSIDGLLIGGCIRHESINFDKKEDAITWKEAIIKGNRLSGIKTDNGTIKRLKIKSPCIQ
jgi:hypothetical protein